MEDEELKAMQETYKSLSPLGSDAQRRVIEWVSGRLDIQTEKATYLRAMDSHVSDSDQDDSKYKTFADLFNNALPTTNSNKVLVAGYWLQICQGHEEFPSQMANKELQNLGHAITNVTEGFNGLKSKKPALAIQVKKSGKSQQARKQYKLTHAGITEVENMIKQNGH